MRRNLNPHAAARVAMAIYGARYAAQRGGSMDFWDALSEGERDTCRRIAVEIKDAPLEMEMQQRQRVREFRQAIIDGTVHGLSLPGGDRSEILHEELDQAREEIERLRAANARLRGALDDLAREHEHQAEVWRDEAGDLDNAGYHNEWGHFARRALEDAAA